MRKNSDAALPATFVAHFGETDSVAARRNFLIVHEKIFGNAARRFVILSLRVGKLLFDGGFFGFNCAPFGGGGGFGFCQRANGGRDAALKLFSGHHALEQAIFGARHFGFGVLDLVLGP